MNYTCLNLLPLKLLQLNFFPFSLFVLDVERAAFELSVFVFVSFQCSTFELCDLIFCFDSISIAFTLAYSFRNCCSMKSSSMILTSFFFNKCVKAHRHALEKLFLFNPPCPGNNLRGSALPRPLRLRTFGPAALQVQFQCSAATANY